MGFFPGYCIIRGLENSIEFPATSSTNCKADDDCVIDSEGRVYDRKSQKRRYAPAGRKFSEELARFATAQRFIVLNVRSSGGWLGPEAVVDLHTEKGIGNKDDTRSPKYVPSRRTFLFQNWPSPQYVPIPETPLDAEVAQLFAEVVTCHELDPAGPIQLLKETEWNERRRKLAERLNEHPAPFGIRRVASDPWFWLRRQADRAAAKNSHEEEIKYLDHLISVEPTWQNYRQRALANRSVNRRVDAGRDWLEAARRAGKSYWHHLIRHRGGANPAVSWAANLADELIVSPTGTLEEYQLGLRLAEAGSRAIPENRDLCVLVPIALYRMGRYADALMHLQSLLKERELDIASQAGQFFMMGWPAVAFSNWKLGGRGDIMEAMAFLAMTHHRLGHRDRARAALDDLRRLGDVEWDIAIGGTETWKNVDIYQRLLREAETLIEGKPRSDK